MTLVIVWVWESGFRLHFGIITKTPKIYVQIWSNNVKLKKNQSNFKSMLYKLLKFWLFHFQIKKLKVI